MPIHVIAVAMMIIIAAVLLLTRAALKSGAKTLLGLAAVVGALGTLATALLAYVT